MYDRNGQVDCVLLGMFNQLQRQLVMYAHDSSFLCFHDTYTLRVSFFPAGVSLLNG